MAVNHGNTWSGFLSVTRTVRPSTASTLATGSIVHMPLEAFDLSASRASENFTSSAVTGRPFPSGKHGSSWNRTPSRMRYVYAVLSSDTSGRSHRQGFSLYGRAA